MPNPVNSSRNESTGSLLWVLWLIFLTSGVCGFLYFRERWSDPLGPGLQLSTAPPVVAATIDSLMATEPAPILTPGGAQAVQSIPELSRTEFVPTSTPEPLCGGPALMVALGIGADSDFEYTYGLADVIRIARVDFVNARVSVLAIPRDLWVEIPDISQYYGITHGKLNQAYFYGGPGMGYYDGPGEGPGLLARTLDLNFGLRVDHYGAVNMKTFEKIVDAVGGIDIYLPTDVDGRPIDDQTEDMGYFFAGQQHFTGDEALRFSRIRKKYNDFTRMDNQNMVLCSLKDKLLSPAVLPKIPQIIGAFQGAIQTDLSLEQITQLACLLPNITRENLVFASLPQEMLTPTRIYSEAQKTETFVLDVDNADLRDVIQKFLEGTWPTASKQQGCP